VTVDPVDVEVVLAVASTEAGSAAGGDVSSDVSVDSGVEVSDVDSDSDSDVDSEEGVCAHASPGEPVTTAAPIPRAMARPPTRPTHAATFTGNGFTTFALRVVSKSTRSLAPQSGE
jgi:hypothetical protein